MRYRTFSISSSVITEAVVVVADNTVHVVGEELLLLFGVDDETVEREFRITVHASDELAVLVRLWTRPAGDCPGLEEAEFLSASGTDEPVRG